MLEKSLYIKSFRVLTFINNTNLSRGTIDSLLGCSSGVDSGHQALDDLEVVVNHLGKRSQTIGGARGVGDYLVARVVRVQVYAYDEHRSVGRRCGDNDLLGTTVQVSL